MLDSEFVRAVSQLRGEQGCAPTTGDVAAMLNLDRTYVWRRLKKIAAIFSVPGKPAPRWHVRGALVGAEARIHALVVEAGELARGLGADDAAVLRAQILEALEGRR